MAISHNNARAKSKKRRLVMSHRSRNILLTVIVVFVIVAIIVGIFVSAGLAPLKLTEQTFSKETQHGYTGGGFYVINGTTIKYIDDKKPELNSERSINTENIKLVACPELSLIYTSNAIYVLNTENPIDMGGTILNVKCGSSHIGVFVEDDKGEQFIAVLDSSLKEVNRITFTDTNPIDFGFDTTRGDVLWTLDVDVNTSKPISTFRTYDLKKRSASGMITVQGELVEDVAFTQNSVFLVGTSTLMCYDRSRNTQNYRLQCYGRELLDVSYVDDYVMMVVRDRGAQDYSKVIIYALSDTAERDPVMRTITLPDETLAVYSVANRMVVVLPDKVVKYRASGSIDKEKQFDSPIDAVEKLTGGRILVYRGNVPYMADIG